MLAVTCLATFGDLLELLLHVMFTTLVWLHSCFMYTTCEAVLVECIGYVIFQHISVRKCLNVQDDGGNVK